MRVLLASLCLAAGACSSIGEPTHIVHGQDWRSIATEVDRERLRNWRSAFTSALAAARAAGHGEDIAREGPLLDPDAALGGAIPNGSYRCRVIKIGAKSEGLLNYIAYPFFTCRIEQQGQVQSFAKLTGSQRQVGIIFPGDPLRQVFLGTLMLGDEERAMHYGVDPERDIAGFVERIGPSRWRLIMPSPRFESQMDVMELVPIAQGAR